MHVWRLCRRRFAKEPLSGQGGLHASGRWHSAPRRIIYTSESLALAGLELLVHIDPDLAPRDLVAIEIELPACVSVTTISQHELPKSWRRYPAPHRLQQLGNAWLDDLKSAVLRVPSAIVPGEHNYLFNPLHPDAMRIRVLSKAPFRLDPRLVRSSVPGT
jgi:RES domain-containing protein